MIAVDPATRLTLVLGGARSGKSAYAETLAIHSGKDVIYIATAQAGDAEMAARIASHRQQRSDHWKTVEAPIALAAAITQWSTPQNLIIVDCLTLWLSNLLFCEAKQFPQVGEILPPACFYDETTALMVALSRSAGEIVMVSNEVGMGIIAQGAVSRWFVDEAGRLNQRVAAISDHVRLVVAGLPMAVKG